MCGGGPATAAKVAWRQLTPTGGPGAMWGQRAIYDPAGHRVLIVGGAVNGDTTISHSVYALGTGASSPTWSVMSTTAPNSFDGAVGFEPLHRRLVVFGGENGSDAAFDKTWICDSTGSWSDVSASVGSPPCPRYETAMTWDASNTQLVLHGGLLAATSFETYDTWILPIGSSVGTWANKTAATCLACSWDPLGSPCSPPGEPCQLGQMYNGHLCSGCGQFCDGTGGKPNLPTPRGWHAMAYDNFADRVLIDEGWYQVNADAGGSAGTEVWLGNGPNYTWSRSSTDGPARIKHGVVFDTRDRQFLMFGGQNMDGSPVAILDTMSTGTQAWAAETDTLTPPARDWHAMAYDPDWGRILVYGGHLATNVADSSLYELRLHDGPNLHPSPISLNTPVGDSGGTVTLNWTATGADGGEGRAVAYDLRYSTSPITSANFGSATRDTTTGVPNWAGTAESHAVSGLSACTTYYFAIKAQDAWGNWGGISNVPSVYTESSTIRPAPIELSIMDGGYRSVDLWWTAVGADSVTCTAAAYDLRKSQSEITDANFNSATQVTSGVPTPQAPGGTESMTVSGLGNCAFWYLAIKVRDGWGNWSAMSNVVSGGTACMQGHGQDSPVIPLVLALGSPRPNPTSGGTMLRFDIPQRYGSAPLDLGIFDVRGRRVKTMRHSAATPGSFHEEWSRSDDNGRRALAGIYFVRLKVGTETRTQTLILR